MTQQFVSLAAKVARETSLAFNLNLPPSPLTALAASGLAQAPGTAASNEYLPGKDQKFSPEYKAQLAVVPSNTAGLFASANGLIKEVTDRLSSGVDGAKTAAEAKLLGEYKRYQTEATEEALGKAKAEKLPNQKLINIYKEIIIKKNNNNKDLTPYELKKLPSFIAEKRSKDAEYDKLNSPNNVLYEKSEAAREAWAAVPPLDKNATTISHEYIEKLDLALKASSEYLVAAKKFTQDSYALTKEDPKIAIEKFDGYLKNVQEARNEIGAAKDQVSLITGASTQIMFDGDIGKKILRVNKDITASIRDMTVGDGSTYIKDTLAPKIFIKDGKVDDDAVTRLGSKFRVYKDGIDKYLSDNNVDKAIKSKQDEATQAAADKASEVAKATARTELAGLISDQNKITSALNEDTKKYIAQLRISGIDTTDKVTAGNIGIITDPKDQIRVLHELGVEEKTLRGYADTLAKDYNIDYNEIKAISPRAIAVKRDVEKKANVEAEALLKSIEADAKGKSLTIKVNNREYADPKNVVQPAWNRAYIDLRAAHFGIVLKDYREHFTKNGQSLPSLSEFINADKKGNSEMNKKWSPEVKALYMLASQTFNNNIESFKNEVFETNKFRAVTGKNPDGTDDREFPRANLVKLLANVKLFTSEADSYINNGGSSDFGGRKDYNFFPQGGRKNSGPTVTYEVSYQGGFGGIRYKSPEAINGPTSPSAAIPGTYRTKQSITGDNQLDLGIGVDYFRDQVAK
jgi:hypothetical protein